MTAIRIMLSLAALAFLLFASCAAPPDLDGAILVEPTPIETPNSASNLTATAPPASTLAPMSPPTPTLTPSPSPTPSPTAMADSVAHMTFRPARLTPDSIDQYIFRADIIVRASFLSAAAGVESAGAAFLPVNNLRFRAVEYLKGTGAAEFTVAVAPFAYSDTTHATRQDALRAAEERLATRNTTWDNREGVLFLTHGTWGASGSSGSSGAAEPLRFALRGVSRSRWDYSLDKLERAWLPAQSAAGASGQSDTDRSYLTSAGARPGAAGAAGSSISLTDLHSKITAIDDLLAKGRGVEGYSNCIAQQFAQETYKREYLAQTGTELRDLVFEHQISSGLAAGQSIASQPERNTYAQSPRYSRFWVEGANKAHFTAGVLDDDQDPTNGWFYYQRTTRPLPADTYQVSVRFVHYAGMPCNYDAGSRYLRSLVVTAPPGTAHEAFFDPVAIGSAIGANGTNGTLEPTSFTAWQSGDKLMLRIRNATPTPTPTATSTPTPAPIPPPSPTPTPTLTPSPTPAPTPLPDPPPGGVSGQ